MAHPSVYAYLDFRTFLQDWFDARKQADPSYSYAAFAEAGTCSKAALANVLSGARNPRSTTLDAFARAMDLGPSERNYLGMLVDLATAPDLATRRATMERILSAERYQQLRLAEKEHDDDVFRYLEHWYIPAVRELASLPGFQPDPEWIAGVLRPRITPEQAEAALQTLFDLDFLRRRSNGDIELREIRFRTAPDATQYAADHFHRQVIPDLLREIDTTQSKDQHVLAATIVLAPSAVPEVKARMNTMVEQLATLGDDRTTAEPHRVYQIAIQLLPISDPVS